MPQIWSGHFGVVRDIYLPVESICPLVQPVSQLLYHVATPAQSICPLVQPVSQLLYHVATPAQSEKRDVEATRRSGV